MHYNVYLYRFRRKGQQPAKPNAKIFCWHPIQGPVKLVPGEKQLQGFFKVIALIIDRDLTAEEYTALSSLVSPDKRAVLERRRNRRAAQNSLLGDILVRRELCRLTGLKNEDLCFAVNEHQKPFLKDRPDIHYNLSHSGNIIVAAFDSKPIGIDVEIIKPVSYQITRKVFDAEEQKHFETLSDREKLVYFYTIWTMKEAYLKKEGLGLSLPMQSFDVFALPHEKFFTILLGEQVVCHVCTPVLVSI
jgi:4'-phosphopantetheinyl transferase